MENEKDKPETTSRRNFAKAVITVAVAAPIAASLAGCKKATDSQNTATPPPVPTGAPQEIPLGVCPEDRTLLRGDHIPPMGIDGAGRVSIETHNTFELIPDTIPFQYQEGDSQNRYGHLTEVVVIEEPINSGTPADPKYDLKITRYCDLPEGTQLLLWYQQIKGAAPVGKDNEYLAPDNFVDLEITGGYGGSKYATIKVGNKILEPLGNANKESTMNRYMHLPKAPSTGSEMDRLFRIGKWEITKTGFKGGGGQGYRFYLRFAKFTP